MSPSSAFSTGAWQDAQKKQQPATNPAIAPQSPASGVAAPPQAPATPPQPPQTWGQHNSQQQERQRNYYGQQAQPQQMPAQTAASYGMPTAPESQPQQQAPPSWAPADFGFAKQSSQGSFMHDAQVDPLPMDQPDEVLKPQPTSGMTPRPHPQRSYYGG